MRGRPADRPAGGGLAGGRAEPELSLAGSAGESAEAGGPRAEGLGPAGTVRHARRLLWRPSVQAAIPAKPPLLRSESELLPVPGSQSGCAEGPLHFMTGWRTFSEIARHFDEVINIERYICWVVTLLIFNRKQRNKLSLLMTHAVL